MPVAPSFNDLITVGQAEAQWRRPDLLFAEGDVSTAVLHGCAAMGDLVLRLAVQLFRDTFLDGARRDALRALVDDRYSIQAQEATAATVTVEFSRTSAGAALPIPAGTVVATAQDPDADEVRFATDDEILVAAGENGPFSVSATAELEGTGGNVSAGTVTRVLASLPDTFTVTNPAAAAGGNDAESDEELRRRARAFYGSLRRATLRALEVGALQVDEVRAANAVVDESGLITVRVSDADGNSNAQMIAAVEDELVNWVAGGEVVTVVGGERLEVDVTMRIRVRAGVSVAVLRPRIQEAVAGRMAKLGVGETLYLDMLTASAIGVAPDSILEVQFDAPAGDVEPLVYQAIRPAVIGVTEI